MTQWSYKKVIDVILSIIVVYCILSPLPFTSYIYIHTYIHTYIHILCYVLYQAIKCILH